MVAKNNLLDSHHEETEEISPSVYKLLEQQKIETEETLERLDYVEARKVDNTRILKYVADGFQAVQANTHNSLEQCPGPRLETNTGPFLRYPVEVDNSVNQARKLYHDMVCTTQTSLDLLSMMENSEIEHQQKISEEPLIVPVSEPNQENKNNQRGIVYWMECNTSFSEVTKCIRSKPFRNMFILCICSIITSVGVYFAWMYWHSQTNSTDTIKSTTAFIQSLGTNSQINSGGTTDSWEKFIKQYNSSDFSRGFTI